MQSSFDWVMSPCDTLIAIPPIAREPSGFDDGTLTHSLSSVRMYQRWISRVVPDSLQFSTHLNKTTPIFDKTTF